MVPILVYGKDNLDRVFLRTQLDNSDFNESVKNILDDVRENKDQALFKYAKQFDHNDINASNILVTEKEIKKAYESVDKSLISSIKKAKQNVLSYHKKQVRRFKNVFFQAGDNLNSKLGWIYRPLNRVGLYVPGGKASYPSTVLMTALPAIAAGVKEVVVCTPNVLNPLVLVACKECGIKKIYKVGGAQAVAAMAYGTQSIEKVDLIAGPGNVFVTLAKKMVFGHVAIDMIAGPSEILVIADETANAKYMAADMLSQAEHDELAASIMVTTSMDIALQVQLEIEKQLNKLSRKEIAQKSLQSNGAIIVAKDINEATYIANKVAPEHLEICTKDADDVVPMIKNAGAIFVGQNSPEPLGDYMAGPSHVLPTSGSSRYSSVLSVDTFMKKISYINYSKDDLLSIADDIINIAESESLTAHANTIKIRKE